MAEPGAKPGRGGRGKAREPLPATTNPVDIALDALRADPSPDNPARILLAKQARLIDLQTHSERVGILLKLLGGAAGLAIAFVIAFLVWEATQARGLVIEAFSVPPAFAANGLTGEVVAAQVQDRLAAMQRRTDSARDAQTFANNWGSDIEVEIPQTGVSVMELRRALRRLLGHETRVTGAVYRTPTGLRVTARVAGQDGDSVDGAEADFDALTARGAEAVFARTQPYRYSVYLSQNDRIEESNALLMRLAEKGSASERPWALTGYATNLDDGYKAVAILRQSAAERPNLALTWFNIGSIEGAMGHAEAALEAAKTGARLTRRSDRGGYSEGTARAARLLQTAMYAELLGDDRTAMVQYEQALKGREYFGIRAQAPASLAAARARLHEASAARRAAAAIGPDDGAIGERLQVYGGTSLVYYFADAAIEDWGGALRQIGRYQAAVGNPEADATTVTPLAAEALARLGRHAEAEALAASTPQDCYLCIQKRGVVAALRGDHRGADRWFATAVGLGPSLPFAYADWGRALHERGDHKAAVARFAAGAPEGSPLGRSARAVGRGADGAGRPVRRHRQVPGRRQARAGVGPQPPAVGRGALAVGPGGGGPPAVPDRLAARPQRRRPRGPEGLPRQDRVAPSPSTATVVCRRGRVRRPGWRWRRLRSATRPARVSPPYRSSAPASADPPL